MTSGFRREVGEICVLPGITAKRRVISQNSTDVLTKIRPVGAKLFRGDGWMDGQTADKQRHNEPKCRFSQFYARA